MGECDGSVVTKNKHCDSSGDAIEVDPKGRSSRAIVVSGEEDNDEEENNDVYTTNKLNSSNMRRGRRLLLLASIFSFIFIFGVVLTLGITNSKRSNSEQTTT